MVLFGVSTYGQREIAYVQNDKFKRSKIFYEILLMRFITLGISLVIFYFTFAANGEYSTYYKILILEIIANALDISWFFQGIEEFKKTVMRNTVVKLVSVICIFIFVKSQEDLYKYFAIYVLSTFIGNISLWFYLPKFIEKVKIKSLKIFSHFKPTISLFIPQIAIQIYTVLDKTMIGAMVEDKSEVGYYEQAQKIVKLLLTIATALGTVMVPRMANVFASKNKEKLDDYLYKSFRFVLTLAFPLMFGVISVANKFVPIFYGDGYEKVIYLIIVISPIILAIGLSNVTGTQYMVTTKQQKKYTFSVVCGAIVNFIFNLLLINLFKSIGASIATVIAEFVVTGTQFYLLRKEISVYRILKLAKNYFIASIIMMFASFIISILISNYIISIIVQVIFSALLYFGLLIIMKDELVLQGVELLKNKLKVILKLGG